MPNKVEKIIRNIDSVNVIESLTGKVQTTIYDTKQAEMIIKINDIFNDEKVLECFNREVNRYMCGFISKIELFNKIHGMFDIKIHPIYKTYLIDSLITIYNQNR